MAERSTRKEGRPRIFDRFDLEIIDRVYSSAWAEIEAREPQRNTENDEERQEALRECIFGLVGADNVDFDALYERALTWIRAQPEKTQASDTTEDLVALTLYPPQ